MTGNNNNNNNNYYNAKSGSNSNNNKKLYDKTVKIIKINTFKAIIEDLNKDNLLEKITIKNNKKGNTPSSNETERAAQGIQPIIYKKLKLNIENIKDVSIKNEVEKNTSLFNAIVGQIKPPNNSNKNINKLLQILD